MTRFHATLGALSMASLLAFGCAQRSERPVVVDREPTPSPQAKVPAGHAIEAIRAYGYEQQDLVVRNLQSVLVDLDHRVGDLRARSKTIAADARDDWNEELTELEQTRDELEVMISRVKFATTDTWDDVKDSAIDRLEDVQEHLLELENTVDG